MSALAVALPGQSAPATRGTQRPIAGRDTLASQQSEPALRLIPRPRELDARGTSPLAHGMALEPAGNADDRFAMQDLAAALKERGIATSSGTPTVRVSVLRADSPAGKRFLAAAHLAIDPAMHDEGYVLLATGTRATIVGATAPGVFYGIQTLRQLIDGRGAGASLHRARIRDWPAMKYRGLHDDLSRGPVPTLDFQKRQIRTFAAYKLNTYSPYYEQSLYYRGNPLTAPPGGAMTPEEVRELVAYARPYHIDVVPEQEAFGHLHHMLKYELYSALGETPHGHVLAPGQPASMALIHQMFAEIDTLFPSKLVHLGADETFELGRGQTMQAVQQQGLGAVYIDFLKRIEEALRPEGKRLLFWGDIAQNSPDLVKTLPKDMIAVAWEYDPAPSFDRLLQPYVAAGMETWVAPGVNNWNRVYPNNAMALPNIQGFVRDGQRLGATGMLNTTWDDDGEALFNQTWYGVLFGAAAGWQPGESSIPDFEASYGRVFHGDTTGMVDEAQRKMAAAHAMLQKAGVGDASDYLFWLDPFSSEGRLTAAKIRPVLHDLRVAAESSLVLVDLARQLQPLRETDALDALSLGARKIDFIGMKFQFADEIAQMYAAAADTTKRGETSRLLSDISGMNGRMADLRDGYSLIRDLYETAWLRENRPYWLHNVLAHYDAATQLWIGRMDGVSEARRELQRTRKLPELQTIVGGTAVGSR